MFVAIRFVSVHHRAEIVKSRPNVKQSQGIVLSN